MVYRIVWKSRITGATGHGQFRWLGKDKAAAAQICRSENWRWPDIEHQVGEKRFAFRPYFLWLKKKSKSFFKKALRCLFLFIRLDTICTLV